MSEPEKPRVEAPTDELASALEANRALASALRHREDQLTAVLACPALVLFAFDRDGIFTVHEGKGVEALGLRPGQLVGQSVFTLFGQRPGAIEHFRRALGGEITLWQNDVGRVPSDALLVPMRDDEGRVTGVTGVAVDVSAQRRAEAALSASESRFRGTIERTSEVIWLTLADGTTTYVSPAVRALLGVEPRELVGQNAASWTFPADRARIGEELRALGADAAQSRLVEHRALHADGSTRWVETSFSNMLDDPGIGAVVASTRDITARKLAEGELRESEERYRRIVETTSEGVVVTDARVTIVFVNQRLADMLGYAREELVGRSALGLVDTAQRDGIVAEVAQSVGPARAFELELRRKDGAPLWVHVNRNALVDAAGVFEGSLALITDVTDRRRASEALAKSEERLRQSQKMEAIGSLAGGVAHDFNNLLSVIMSYTAMALEQLPAEAPMREELEQIALASQQATDLTRQLLAFSRHQVLQPRLIDLGQTVRGLEKMLARLLGEDVELTLFLGADLGLVYADPGQLEQVVMNLAVNARDAMANGGSLTIETTQTVLDDAYAKEHVGVTAGPHVVLTVTDTGTGMDAATAARVFEPFFTTKPVGKGTGLGLSTVFGIVTQSGGHVTVYSELGIGTMFTVYLPRRDDARENVSAEIEPPSLPRGTETLLLVEDQERVRAAMHRILTRQGYVILEAESGADALLVAERHAGTIDALVTDVVMPRMNGRELAARIVASRPGIKVLFVSGYAENAIIEHGILDRAIAYLQKPFTPASLARKVREVLDARA